MAWAYATTRHGGLALLESIAAEAAPRLRDFSPQELADTAWAYAAADAASAALFDGPMFAELCDAAAEGFGPAQLKQLHQWQLWLDERGAAWPRLSPALAARCRESTGAEEGAGGEKGEEGGEGEGGGRGWKGGEAGDSEEGEVMGAAEITLHIASRRLLLLTAGTFSTGGRSSALHFRVMAALAALGLRPRQV
jgi:hypothetical protein